MDKNCAKIIFKNKVAKNDAKTETKYDANAESNNESIVDKYIQQLNPLQIVAYEIAKSRLKTSFDIEKSIGFKTFTNG
jgi:hypothetical protein